MAQSVYMSHWMSTDLWLWGEKMAFPIFNLRCCIKLSTPRLSVCFILCVCVYTQWQVLSSHQWLGIWVNWAMRRMRISRSQGSCQTSTPPPFPVWIVPLSPGTARLSMPPSSLRVGVHVSLSVEYILEIEASHFLSMNLHMQRLVRLNQTLVCFSSLMWFVWAAITHRCDPKQLIWDRLSEVVLVPFHLYSSMA